LITDLSDYRLEQARACGIAGTCNINTEPLAHAVQRIFGEEGFDVAFEAVGVESALDDAVQHIC